MKCINRKLSTIFILFVIPNLMIGCGEKELPMAYSINHPVSSYQLNTTDIGVASSFAIDLCVSAEDVTENSEIDTTSVSAAGLFDITKKQVLYAENIHKKLSPASLTKVLTAIVALENGNLDDVITVGDEVLISEDGTSMCGFNEGDIVTLDQVLHGFLVSSGNDAGNIIAKHIGGTVENFIVMMNRKAKELGATNSNFENAHGLTADNHYTTAYDLYLIFENALQYEYFKEIISLTNYTTVYHNADGAEVELNKKTTNQYLRGNYKSPDTITVMGGKTGTTSAAGSCLLLYSKDTEGNPYISIILGAEGRDSLYLKMTELLNEI